MKAAAKEHGRRVVVPLARGLARIGVSPNQLTALGLAVSAGAGALMAFGRFRAAALALLAGGLCDMLDGAVARVTGRSTRFGAFLDSTVDRYAEMLVFGGLLVYFTRVEPSLLYLLLTFFAAGASFMVSYTRARAEGLNIDCAVGVMERPERIVLLILASLAGAPGIRVALWVLAVMALWTSFQRIHHVYRETRSR